MVKSKFIYIILAIFPLFSSCIIFNPMLGYYVFTSNDGQECTPPKEPSDIYYKKSFLTIAPDKIINKESRYLDIDCTIKYDASRKTQNYQTHGTFTASTIETDSTGITTETGNTVEATKFDYLLDKKEIYCYTDECVTYQNSYFASKYATTGNNIYCLISFSKNQWIDVTSCALLIGDRGDNKNIYYISVYYDSLSRKLYSASPESGYSRPGDTIFYDGTSSETRPKYIEIGSWYDKISDEY